MTFVAADTALVLNVNRVTLFMRHFSSKHIWSIDDLFNFKSAITFHLLGAEKDIKMQFMIQMQK